MTNRLFDENGARTQEAHDIERSFALLLDTFMLSPKAKNADLFDLHYLLSMTLGTNVLQRNIKRQLED